MKTFLIACALILCACSPSRLEREGQRIFAGCISAVDDKATLRAGVFVCKGARDPAPFDGNGRACGSCHVPGDNFGINTTRIASLPDTDPIFFAGLEEDEFLLRNHAMFFVSTPEGVTEFRQTPKLVHLHKLCNRSGNCDALGLLGDRTRNLNSFSIQAIMNHLSKTPARIPGQDFRTPTAAELKALTAYQLSTLVSQQDERNRGSR